MGTVVSSFSVWRSRPKLDNCQTHVGNLGIPQISFIPHGWPCVASHLLKYILRSVSIISLATGVVAQSGEILPGNNLIVDGIPKIPASLASDVGSYREHVGDSLVGWDPVKLGMTMIRKRPDGWQIGNLAGPGETPVRFAYAPGGSGGIFYQPQGKSLVFNVDDTSGTEVMQLVHYDIATGVYRMLSDGKSRNLYPLWSNSGEWIIYSSTRRNGKDLDLYVVRPDDQKSERQVVQLNGSDWAAFDWSPNDRQVIISDYRSTNESYLWILDIATGAKTLLTPNKRAEKIFNGSYAQFSKDAKGVYHITDRDSEFQRLAYVDINSGRYTYLTSHIKWDVEEFGLSPDRRLLAFVTNEDGTSKLHLLNTANGRELRAPHLPTGIVSDLRWHNNSRYLGFVISSTVSPGDLYSIDVRSGNLEQWTKNAAPAGQTLAMGEPELIRWKSFDGRAIPGFIYRPPARFTGRRPVLIDIHGGFKAQYRPGFRSRDTYFTSSMGIAMIYPNIRGSGGYGKNYMTLDNQYLREDSYKDIGSLLDWIKTQPDLDAENVVVRGSSLGGNVALAVASCYGNRIRGAIARMGYSNIATFLDTVDDWYRDSFREEFGDERDSKMRQYLERIAPVRNVKHIKIPLLIVHGKLDRRVPVSESERMIAAAKREGISVWSLLIKNEGHGIADTRTRDFVFLTEVVFVKRYLGEADVSR